MYCIPGGGYSHLSTREGEPIAIRMNAMGFHAAVLRYSLTPNIYPSQLLEAAAAMRIVKEHAAEWHVDLEHIVIAGFSAGAHVAGSLGTLWREQVITDVLGGKAEDYRPTAQLLCYPVITSGEFAHRGSISGVTGDNAELYEKVSLEKQVSADTAPAFLWHTFADATVPVENSLFMAAALHKHGIPCELHVFERGRHGLALASAETDTPDGATHEDECTVWPELFYNWLLK